MHIDGLTYSICWSWKWRCFRCPNRPNTIRV